MTAIMNPLSRKLMLLLPIWSLLVTGCGRTDRIYSDPSAPVSAAASPPILIDGRPLLPQGFYDQSVNRAVVSVALDGTTSMSSAIRLQTNVGSNEVGGFNGAGLGNRALLGLSNSSGRKLVDLPEITFDSKPYLGTEPISVLLLTDLNCDGSSLRVLVAEGATLAPGSFRDSDYVRFTAGLSEPKWKVSGPDIVDPNASTTVLVPSTTSSSSAVSLQALLTTYPLACLRNGNSGDDGLPRNIPTASILFSLGTTDNQAQLGAYIRRISVGTEVYEDLERGPK